MLFTEFTKNAINVLTNLFQQMECSVKRKMYLPVLGHPLLFSWKGFFMKRRYRNRYVQKRNVSVANSACYDEKM